MSWGEGKGDRQTDRQTDRERKIETEREAETQRERETETQRERRGLVGVFCNMQQVLFYDCVSLSLFTGCLLLLFAEIVDNVKSLSVAEDCPFRPYTGWLTCDDYVISCMQECWTELPEQRPDFKTIWQKLKPMRAGMYV